MILRSKGCLFPDSADGGLQIRQCTSSTCSSHALYSVVSARCPVELSSNYTTSIPLLNITRSSTEIIRSRCRVNRATEIFYWDPPIPNCVSAKSKTPYFYGSLYALRQLQHAFETGKAAAVAIREKPLVSLSVGMSALSVVLVLIMLLGVCHRNTPAAASMQRQRQAMAAARRRARARNRAQNANHASIGTQAEVPAASAPDVHVILPRPTEIGGVNAGFHDSEALLAHSQELAGSTPAMTFAEEATGEGDLSAPGGSCSFLQTAGSVATIEGSSHDQQPNNQPRIFKGVPCLPTYEDAAKRGMYCIIRESDITRPPAYRANIHDEDADSEGGVANEAANFTSITSWDFDAYGVHRGSVNSMPEFSRIYGPPESPYPGDSPQ